MKAIDERTKSDFPKDEEGRTYLKTVEDIAYWVELGFQEQKKKYDESPKMFPLYLVIDLSNCNLSSSCSQDIDGNEYRIFNFCDLADHVEGITTCDNIDNVSFLVSLHIDFSRSLLYGAFFHYVTFIEPVTFNDAKITTGTASFFNCIFEKWVRFDIVLFPETTTFTNCSFKGRVSFSGADFKTLKIEFANVIFSDTFEFDSVNFHSNTPTEMSEPLFFDRCMFLNGGSFASTNFTLKTQFFRCTLQGKMFFTDNTFSAPLDIENCNIDGTLIFNSEDNKTMFNIKEVFLSHNIINGSIHFELRKIGIYYDSFSTIKNDGQLRFSESEIETLNIEYNTIYGRMDIIKSTIKRINLNSTIVPGFLNVEDSELELENIDSRHTARILKNEAIKLNNVIQAQQMKTSEMALYLRELCKCFRGKENYLSWASFSHLPFGKLILLFFNRISNDHGYKWGRGVLFTVLSALFFYLLILFFGTNESILDYLKNFSFGIFLINFLHFLNVLNFGDKLDGTDLNAFGEFILFLSKIVIPYGIYQTVSAFRKYGK